MFHVEQILTDEIILLLLRGPLHPRGIAESLGTNHATVLRRLAVLVGNNVLDYTIEGKNKIYFLKKTIEARNYAITAELYKQSRAITTHPLLRGVVKAVLDVSDIRLALIFGSYAKGTPHQDSDIDLFIETAQREIKINFQKQFSILNVKTGQFDIGNSLIREIISDHIIVKGVEEYFEKVRIFT
jgi:predicted nucleotidyltransferase